MSLHSLNRNQLLKLSLTISGRVADDNEPTASQYSKAAEVINMVNSNFMNVDTPLIQLELKSTSVSAASFSLEAEDEDIALIYVSNGSSDDDPPMVRLSKEEYYTLSDKTTTGTPYHFYIDYQTTRVCYLYPVPSGETIKYLAIKKFQKLTSSTTIPLDNRYYLWLTYECASILCDFYQIDMDRTIWLAKRATHYKKQVSAKDKRSYPSFKNGTY